jgi:hypothetical protein
MVNVDFSQVFLLFISLLGGMLVYFLKKLVDKVDSISTDIGEMRVMMKGHEENLVSQLGRIDRLEDRVEKLEE